jgi:methionyl aminopeptidase
MQKTNSITIKTSSEMKIMKEGGKKLGQIKKKLIQKIKEGVSAAEIEELACSLIEKQDGKPSFKMVPGYSWATCININEGVVHGIPKKTIIFKKGDVVSIDLGIFYKGFHNDTSFSIAISPTKDIKEFLKVGEKSLEAAIDQAIPGNRIYDISKAMEDVLKENKLQPVEALVGHGIGKNLHEQPQIPCFVSVKRDKTPIIPEGATFAIEVMYTMGLPGIQVEEDGWTIKVKDDKISGLFEETVAISSNGPIVLTQIN